MRAYWRAVLAVVWKDALLELRTKEIAISLLVFALLAVVVFNFAIDPTPRTAATVGPGILWGRHSLQRRAGSGPFVRY